VAWSILIKLKGFCNLPTENEISSTDRLLKQIRGENKNISLAPEEIKPTPPADSRAPKEKPQKRKAFLSQFFSSTSQISIGVDFDIRKSEIRFAKIEQTSEQNWRLLEYHKVPFKPGTYMESPEFSALVKKTLTEFCGGSPKSFNIWSNIPSAHVEVRYFRIPKVPRKQLARTVQFAFRKEVPYEKSHSLFDFEMLGEITEDGIRKLSVVAYTAPRAEVVATGNLFAKCGFPLAGITIVPFAIQNLLRTGWVKEGTKGIVCNLYIGTDWSRIDIFYEGSLIVMRGVKTGLNSMAEAILDDMNAKWAMLGTSQTSHVEDHVEDIEETEPDIDFNESEPLQGDFSNGSEEEPVSLSMANELNMDQLEPVNNDEALKILFSLSPDSPQLTEEDPGYKLSENEIYEMIYPAVDRLIRQVERTFQHFSSTFHGESVGTIYISGKIDLSGGLADYVARQLGIPGEVINPFAPDIPFAKGIAVASPLSVTEKLSFAPTVGLALSENSRTPNFTYTYREKSKKIIVSKFDRAVFIAFLIAMSACIGVSIWQSKEAKEKNLKLTQLKQQLELFRPEPDKNLITKMATKVAMKRQSFRRYSKRYRGMAAISEISAMTPNNVSLLSSSTIFPDKADGKGTMILEGKVRGKRRILEATLAGYVLKLAGSPLFEQPSVNKSVIESENDNDVLHFTVQIEMH
jgi:Tfp pilus assembly PilM family ATPase